MEIRLDGKQIKNKELLFIHLKNEIKSLEFIGNNLDALWDVLSSYNSKISVKIINVENLINNLGDYGKSLISLFKELDNIALEIN